MSSETIPKFGDTVVMTAPNIKEIGDTTETRLIGKIVHEQVSHKLGSQGLVRSFDIEITLDSKEGDEALKAMRFSNVPLGWVEVIGASQEVDIPVKVAAEVFKRVALTLPGMWTVQGDLPLSVTYKDQNGEWKTWKKDPDPVKTFNIGEK